MWTMHSNDSPPWFRCVQRGEESSQGGWSSEARGAAVEAEGLAAEHTRSAMGRPSLGASGSEGEGRRGKMKPSLYVKFN